MNTRRRDGRANSFVMAICSSKLSDFLELFWHATTHYQSVLYRFYGVSSCTIHRLRDRLTRVLCVHLDRLICVSYADSDRLVCVLCAGSDRLAGVFCAGSDRLASVLCAVADCWLFDVAYSIAYIDCI